MSSWVPLTRERRGGLAGLVGALDNRGDGGQEKDGSLKRQRTNGE